MIDWLANTFEALGYRGIFIMMAMEGSIFPVPSELVIPRAGYLAHQGEMSLLAIILCGSFGSLAGAYLNYLAARHLGRPLLLKYGRLFWLNEKTLARAEAFFLRHGEMSTFVGRLLPGVRHLISLPAGLWGMSHFKFSLYTLLGSGSWVTVLALVGYWIGEQQSPTRQANQALAGVVLLCLVLISVYSIFVWRRWRRQ